MRHAAGSSRSCALLPLPPAGGAAGGAAAGGEFLADWRCLAFAQIIVMSLYSKGVKLLRARMQSLAQRRPLQMYMHACYQAGPSCTPSRCLGAVHG